MRLNFSPLVLIVVFLLSLGKCFSQGNARVPKSIIDLGAGAGPNYGIIGGQAVIGYKGNGLLVAAGYFNGLSTYEIGGQLSLGLGFINFGYGVYATYENLNTGRKSTLNGMILAAGLKFGLLKSKRLTIQISCGPAWGAVVKTPFGSEKINGFLFNAGIGFRIPYQTKEKKT